MSLNKFNFKSLIIVITLILLVRVNVYSTVYTTISDGNWNSNSNWSPSKPKMTYGFKDTVIVANEMNMTSNLSLFGFVKVENTGIINSNSKSITIKEYATLLNNGTIEVKNLILDWGENTLTNNSNITLNGYFKNSEGYFNNNGTIIISSDFDNSWDAYTTNNGSLVVSGDFLNSNVFSGNGSIEVGEDFTNNWNASFNSTGAIEVGEDFVNRGSAQLGGKVTVEKDFTNDWSSTLVMSDTVLISDEINNRGSFSNNGYLGADDFKNEGPFQSTGTTMINGDVENKSSISNSGTFSVEEDFKNKWNNTSLNNTGNFIVGEDFTNNGLVVNDGLAYVVGELENTNTITNNGNLFVDGVVSGSGSISGSGVICNSDGQTDPTVAKSNTVSCDVCDGTVNTLPVKLVTFEAELVESTQVNVYWATASEENNDFFEVLHSTDGIDFETIAIVDGAGNSNVMIKYQITDFNAADGINYYQLKQVDYDGKTTLSNILTVRINTENEIKLYPNPVNLGQMIKVEFNDVLNYKAEIYDITGRLVMNLNGMDNQMSFSTTNLSKGNYILRIIDGDQAKVKRFIVE